MFLAAVLVLAGIKIAGAEFVPKDLVFADPDPKSRVVADGTLPNQCTWLFVGETRLARHAESQECVRFYFKTSLTLTQECAAPNEQQQVRRSCDRVTATDVRCPDDKSKIAPPPMEAKALSSGTSSERKHQDVVLFPDGTRVVLLYDGDSAAAAVAFPDGTGDLLKVGK